MDMTKDNIHSLFRKQIGLIRTTLALGLFVACTSATTAQAIEYKIDENHSQIGFKIRHLAISNVLGSFSEFSGSINFDPNDIPASSASASVAVSTIDTSQKKRDDHLRSEDFFAVEKFPAIKFVSKSVKNVSGNSFDVEGDLTIRDITKPVVLDVTYEGAATDPWGNNVAAFSATTLIDRRDFGLTWSKVIETGALVVGNDVKISLEIEAIQKKQDG